MTKIFVDQYFDKTLSITFGPENFTSIEFTMGKNAHSTLELLCKYVCVLFRHVVKVPVVLNFHNQ